MRQLPILIAVAVTVAVALAWGGCFNVELPNTYYCSAAKPECPEGKVCKNNVCVTKGAKLDMTVDTPVADDQGTPDSAAPDSAAPDSALPDAPVPDKTAPDKTIPDAPAPDKALPDLQPPDWLFNPDGCVRVCKHMICSSYLDFCPPDPCKCGCDGVQYQCHCLPGPCGNGAIGGNSGQVDCASDLAFVTNYYKPSIATGWTCFKEPKKP